MTDTGGIDERARLEAIVYGRPTTTEAERAAAATALRALSAPVVRSPPPGEHASPVAESRPHENANLWLPPGPISAQRRVARAVTAMAAGCALIAAISFSPTPIPVADSMVVFEHPQTASDTTAATAHGNLPGAGPDLDVSTVRLVAEPADGVVVLAYRTINADVCLAIMVGGGGGGSCVNEADFRLGGLHGGTLFPPSGWRYAWGPFGDPVISGPDD